MPNLQLDLFRVIFQYSTQYHKFLKLYDATPHHRDFFGPHDASTYLELSFPATFNHFIIYPGHDHLYLNIHRRCSKDYRICHEGDIANAGIFTCLT